MNTDRMKSGRAIVITGPVGAGKSTVMAALTDVLEEHEVPNAGIDMDHLRWFYPKLPGDPFGGQIGRAHLAFIASSYHDLRIPVLVLADVVEQVNDRDAIAAALPDYDVHVIRLRVPMDLIQERLRGRESADRLPWYLDRAVELEQIMDNAAVGDTIIDVGTRSAREVAEEIVGRLQLL